jgi:hypothetical protein
MDKPACFSTVRFYENWRAMLPRCNTHERADPICRDCMPTYQLRMKSLGRCAHPETMFTVGQDGGVVVVPA